MICYRDMTFCPYSACEHFGDGLCPRSLTKSVLRSAEAWWGGKDFPLSLYNERPSCFQLCTDEKQLAKAELANGNKGLARKLPENR